MNRYRWVTVDDEEGEPKKHWLFDILTERFLAEVEESAGGWNWSRRTNSESGMAESLALAKAAVEGGLEATDSLQ